MRKYGALGVTASNVSYSWQKHKNKRTAKVAETKTPGYHLVKVTDDISFEYLHRFYQEVPRGVKCPNFCPLCVSKSSASIAGKSGVLDENS
jgi:hypothetical protein